MIAPPQGGEESPNTLLRAIVIAEKTLLTATERKLRESLVPTQEGIGSVLWGNPQEDATETFKPPSIRSWGQKVKRVGCVSFPTPCTATCSGGKPVLVQEQIW